jgi:DNA-directed RNA polymerase subunit RPC12/RpoP
MADIAPRLKSIKQRIVELARLAGNEQAEAAHMLAAELTDELDRVMEEASAPQVAGARPQPTRLPVPRDEVVKCPRCTLRSFTFQKGTVRKAADAAGGFEALFKCMSCGHEGWREIG